MLIIVILTSFFWWQLKFSTKKIKIDLEESVYKPALNIEGAKYSGFSKNGQKYSISASLISERDNNTKVLKMIRPSASIISKNQSILISSNKGEFNLENKKIVLNDNVSLIDKKMDYEFLSETGIFGLFCFLIFIFFSIILSLKNYIQNKNIYQFSALVIVVVSILPVIPMGSFFATYPSSIFWINYAIMMGYNYTKKN